MRCWFLPMLMIALLVALATAASAADPQFVTVEAAHNQAKNGKIMLVDVRSEREWHKTGVPQNSKMITIHNPGGIEAFVEEVTTAVKGDKTKPLALICAAGVRSTIAIKALRRAGFSNLTNVREGMLGNATDGPGWLKKKLPVRTVE